jgi:hypothetical protein
MASRDPKQKKPTGGEPVGFLFRRGAIAGKPAELSCRRFYSGILGADLLPSDEGFTTMVLG